MNGMAPGSPDGSTSGAGHRPAVDVARVGALAIVVLGHLTLAVIDRDGDELRGANLLALRPGWAWVAAASPMPVFFAAAGWANATSTLGRAAPRLRALAGVGAAVVAAWSAAVVVMVLVTGDAGIVADGARIATQPLWFLAAYAPLSAWGAPVAAVAARRPVVAIGGCLGLLLGLDLWRFGLGLPARFDWVGWVGFLPAWGVPWLAGAWWRSRAARWSRARERLVGAAMAAGGALVAASLVARVGYAPQLIDVVSGERSNTTPPTLYTAVAGLTQFGVLVALAPWLDRVGRRWSTLWRRAGRAAVGVYAWHLTALALCAGIVAAGLPVPRRLTLAWWLTRPVWWAGVLGVAAVFVAATARSSSDRADRTSGRATGTREWVGVSILTVAAAGVGLRGPTTPARAVTAAALFVAAWWSLRPPRGASRTYGLGRIDPAGRRGPVGRSVVP